MTGFQFLDNPVTQLQGYLVEQFWNTSMYTIIWILSATHIQDLVRIGLPWCSVYINFQVWRK